MLVDQVKRKMERTTETLNHSSKQWLHLQLQLGEINILITPVNHTLDTIMKQTSRTWTYLPPGKNKLADESQECTWFCQHGQCQVLSANCSGHICTNIPPYNFIMQTFLDMVPSRRVRSPCQIVLKFGFSSSSLSSFYIYIHIKYLGNAALLNMIVFFKVNYSFLQTRDFFPCRSYYMIR